MSAKDLVDALKDLRDRLEDDGYRTGIIEFVAHEWEVNPELLLRKFEESEGVPPEKWDVGAALDRRIEAAAKEARVMSRNFARPARFGVLDGEEVELAGLPVRTLTRRRVVAVACTREALMGIDITTSTRGNPMEKFPFVECFASKEKLIEQLTKAWKDQEGRKSAPS